MFLAKRLKIDKIDTFNYLILVEIQHNEISNFYQICYVNFHEQVFWDESLN